MICRRPNATVNLNGMEPERTKWNWSELLDSNPKANIACQSVAPPKLSATLSANLA
jgi:hypothetical protein